MFYFKNNFVFSLQFVRRLLRQGLTILKNASWSKKEVKNYNDVLSDTVLSFEKSLSQGMTLHFTEIYLEELAKVSGGNLNPNLLTEMLRPFVKQLSLLEDKRQINTIKRYIFRYLLKQSDAAIEHEQKFKAWKHVSICF